MGCTWQMRWRGMSMCLMRPTWCIVGPGIRSATSRGTKDRWVIAKMYVIPSCFAQKQHAMNEPIWCIVGPGIRSTTSRGTKDMWVIAKMYVIPSCLAQKHEHAMNEPIWCIVGQSIRSTTCHSIKDRWVIAEMYVIPSCLAQKHGHTMNEPVWCIVGQSTRTTTRAFGTGMALAVLLFSFKKKRKEKERNKKKKEKKKQRTKNRQNCLFQPFFNFDISTSNLVDFWLNCGWEVDFWLIIVSKSTISQPNINVEDGWGKLRLNVESTLIQRWEVDLCPLGHYFTLDTSELFWY